MIPGNDIGGSLAGRRIRFWTPLGPDAFQLESLRGKEALSALYSFRLRFRTPSPLSQPLNILLGQPAVIEIELPNPAWETLVVSGNIPQLAHRRFCGILSKVAQVRQDELYTYFRATLVPQLWQRKLGSAYRAFHQQDTQEIVSTVLASTSIRWELSQPLEKRNYTVQYGESDFHFISRLLEEDGLFYFFEHTYDGQPADSSEARERLVICDTTERLVSLSPQDTFDFDEINGGNRSSMRIRRFTTQTRLAEPHVDALDRHFQLPSQPVLGSAGMAGSVEIDGGQLQWTPPASVPAKQLYPADFAYRYDNVSPSGAAQPEDLQQIFDASQRDAKLRAERLTCAAISFTGTGDVAAMTPGFLFQLRKDLRTGQPFYLTEVRHLAQLSNSERSGNDVPSLLYKNQFRCLPKTVPYRPERKHGKRRINGLVAATVVNDPNVTNDQVCVDCYGRIKVCFPWQKTDDANPSCWIRVSQLWAGNRWGAFFWPRVGQEVLVAFEHGDPERPIVVGCVYNTENMPPLVLPQYKLSSGIHSCSHQGNPMKNYSAVVFHDQPNEEFLQLHSETFECLTSETESIHHSAGKSLQVKGHNSFFDLISDISGMGGGEEEGDDGTRARFGFKGREGTFVEVLQLLGVIPRAGSMEIETGMSVKKSLGREVSSSFGSGTSFTFDVVSLLRRFLASKIPGSGVLASCAKFLIGPSSSNGESSVRIGEEHAVTYGGGSAAHHGSELEITFSPDEETEVEGNAGIIIVGVGDFAKTLMKFMAVFDLLLTIIAKILLEVGGKGEKGDSYLKGADGLELATSIIMPELTNILVKSQNIGARLESGKQSATDAVEEAQAFFYYILARGASPGFKAAITEELANTKYVSAYEQVSSALAELAASLSETESSDE